HSIFSGGFRMFVTPQETLAGSKSRRAAAFHGEWPRAARGCCRWGQTVALNGQSGAAERQHPEARVSSWEDLTAKSRGAHEANGIGILLRSTKLPRTRRLVEAVPQLGRRMDDDRALPARWRGTYAAL